MEPALSVAILWLLFGGLHIGLASGRIRAALVRQMGEGGFTALFSVLAAGTFALLVSYYAAHRLEGVSGPAFGEVTVVRWTLVTIIVVGVVLTAGSLSAYPRSPMAIFATTVASPRGIERITRHPFFMGLTLVALAHVLLSTRLVGSVFTMGFVILATVGAWHQDRKLLALRGRAYADYVASTSAVPFGAIVAGRQRLVWRELPVGALGAGVAVAFLLRAVHADIFVHGGLWVITATLTGAALLTLEASRHAARQKRRLAGEDARPEHSLRASG